nr:hypothetical protein [Tanacetum cinerariifolium]
MLDSEDSMVTYTEDPYAYVEAALQARPSPNYVLGPKHLPSPAYAPEFVLEPLYPEFMSKEDDILPAEELPLPAAVLPTLDSPGYIPEFNLEEDPEEDPKEDDEYPEEDPADYPTSIEDDEEESFKDDADDKEEDEDEEDEHPASTDSVPPPVHRVTARMSVQAQTPILLLSETEIILPPLPISSLPLPASPTYPLGYRAVMIRLRAKAPSTSHPLPSSTPSLGTPPLLPIPLPTSSPHLLLPSTSHRANVLKVTLPPQKRLCIALGLRFKVGKSSSTPTARLTGGFRADYGFVGTLDDEIRRDPKRDTKTAALQRQQGPARGPSHPEKMAPKRTTRSTPATTTTTTTTLVTNTQLKALIDQGVADALAAHDADRSRNGEDIHDSETGVRRQAHPAHECTYQDFMKCKPL